jgi:hypothetical protein
MVPQFLSQLRKFLGSSKAILRLGRFDVRAAANNRRSRGGTIDQRSTCKGAPVSRRRPLVPLTVLCIAAASLLLAACGGSSPTNAASTERSEEQKAETKFADFAKCLREHGVNAEAISHPGGGHGLKVSPGTAGGGAGGGPRTMEAAEKACARYRPEPQKVNLSPQQKVEQEEAVQKFAKCMRAHGIKVEASTRGGGVQIGIHVRAGQAGAPNPESPAFQEAQSKCQGLLPKPPGGKGPGPGFATGGPHGPASGPNTSAAHGQESSVGVQAGG